MKLGSIKEITVEQLFGRYSYHIILGSETDGNTPPIALLYGDNGTGKTTILRLVFHLLSSAVARGHKTYVSRTPFQNLSVAFSDKTRVFASRDRGKLTGEFNLGLSVCGNKPKMVKVSVDHRTGAVMSDRIPPELISLMSNISAAVPDVFYLGDDRTIESDTLPKSDRRTIGSRVSPHFDDDDLIVRELSQSEQRERALQSVMERAQHQIYVELAGASTRGEANARQIYADVLRSIVSASASSDVVVIDKAPLEQELKKIELISQKLAEFELGAAIDTAPLKKSLFDADGPTSQIVVQVLRSFLDGQRARLDELSILYEKMHTLVSTINGYFADKEARLHVSKGLSIRIPGNELEPGLLSSGEQHLLLLFLNVFTSSNQSSLFIIDEPELSLNVKWQRELVDSLLRLTHNSPCQFLLATHSIELLSKHERYVTQLKP